MGVTFFNPISFSSRYLEDRKNLNQSVLLEKCVKYADSFFHFRGSVAEVYSLPTSNILSYQMVSEDCSYAKNVIKIIAYLLIIPIVVALVIKIIARTILLCKYRLRPNYYSSPTSHSNSRENLLSSHNSSVNSTLVSSREINLSEHDSMLIRRERPNLSDSFLNLLENNFPVFIPTLFRDQNFSPEEVGLFFKYINVILSQDSLVAALDVFPVLKTKIMNFGLDRIENIDSETAELYKRKFKDILLSYCPFFWLSKFCFSNSDDDATRLSYWISLSIKGTVILSPVWKIFAEVVKEEEFNSLVNHINRGAWGNQGDSISIVSAIQERYEQYIISNPDYKNYSNQLTRIRLRYVLNCGFSFKGICLLKNLTLQQVLTFQTLTENRKLLDWESLGILCRPSLESLNSALLITWEDLCVHGMSKNSEEFKRYLREISR
ncbi:hypothetical protein CP10139811_0190 [Chlamydia ibidis]|uniref:Uncharacterized protein n=2 Tax=Chlamydia ibidis TaxID=1405396 RepID=S7J515_9CHLA|nr:DUF1389 domain-containing protein [Chlamydia ibidis]EPP35283.1 hypothetical protein CP10139811_0190 [Chlamydia ibidis]EQM62545.1 hypothetical protein H359_0635 [Chlamydia ibidis 10-1398/6]